MEDDKDVSCTSPGEPCRFPMGTVSILLLVATEGPINNDGNKDDDSAIGLLARWDELIDLSSISKCDGANNIDR